MKKKVLSLLMAAAVVATTAVPAHAQTYEANDTETINANVTVTGTVSDIDGTAPQGKMWIRSLHCFPVQGFQRQDTMPV